MLIQIRFVLEGIGIDVAFAQRFIRQNIIIKGHQFHVQAVFFFRDFLRDFGNLLLCANDYADFNMI